MKLATPHNEKQSETITTFRIRFTDETDFALAGSSAILRQVAEVSKAINAGVVSIGPAGLQGITADEIEPHKLETLLTVTEARTRNGTKDVRLAAAPGTRTRASQWLEFQE
jgi:hypothetical protein